MYYVQIAFIVIGVVFSVLRGWYATTILVEEKDGEEVVNKVGELLTWYSERKAKATGKFQHHWSWWAHQVLINFLGSAVGWGAAYYLIFCRTASQTSTGHEVMEVFLVLLALAGIFGFLPWLIFKGSLKG